MFRVASTEANLATSRLLYTAAVRTMVHEGSSLEVIIGVSAVAG